MPAGDIEPEVKEVKAEADGSLAGARPSLSDFTPDLIRKMCSSLVVYNYEANFRMDLESKLERLCCPGPDVQLRKTAIEALGTIGSQLVLARIGVYLLDSHSTIRLAAARSLMCLFRRNVALSISSLDAIKACAADDYEPLRFEAADLIWALACSHQDYTVCRSNDDGPQSLTDILFIVLCQLCLDSSARIRSKAAHLLGALPSSVDKRLLLQTFSKVPLLELTSGGHQSARFEFHSSDVDDLMARKEFVELCALPSFPIPDHIAGVFVHGLEDEFASVRQAALDSICSISRKHELLAFVAFDFLVDMFHDELLPLRIASIQAVHSLLRHYPSLTFSQVQLLSLLSNLSDCQSCTRYETLRLLKTVTLRTGSLLQAAVLALLRCVSSFPDDQDMIFDTIQIIGSTHSDHSRLVIQEWLSKDRATFDHQSVLTSGPCYLAFLLFVKSAESQQLIDALPSLFSDLLKHCCDRFPSFKSSGTKSLQSHSWQCPSETVADANEALSAWSECRYTQAKVYADRLLTRLRRQTADAAPATQANIEFCCLYAEWIWTCCTVLAGKLISVKVYEDRAKQIVFLLSESFFGLSNEELSHVLLLQNFTSIAPRWWPDSLALKRFTITMRSPRSDPGNPVVVRPQAASVILIEADLSNAYRYEKLMIRRQIHRQCNLYDVPAKDISPGGTPWSCTIATKIRLSCYDIAADSADPTPVALIGFVWRHQPDYWLNDPIKLYLNIATS